MSKELPSPEGKPAPDPIGRAAAVAALGFFGAIAGFMLGFLGIVLFATDVSLAGGGDGAEAMEAGMICLGLPEHSSALPSAFG